jgi:hypothetical protein
MKFAIQHKEENNKGNFYIENDGNIIAEMTYSKAGTEKLIIDHTEVDVSLKGQGVGLQLVEAGVAYARTHNLKIIPLCSFANAMFKRHTTFKDVLA